MKPYEIRYTRLARSLLGECVHAFEEQFRGELEDEMGEEGEAEDLLFHSMEFERQLFVGVWRDEGWLLIDTATEEESEIQSGPNKGQKLILPRPDSE